MGNASQEKSQESKGLGEHPKVEGTEKMAKIEQDLVEKEGLRG